MDYTLNQRNVQSTSVIESIVYTTPKGSFDAYFRDSIGNVSTSRIVNDAIVLTPRFPLFGGWKYSFDAGYETPLIIQDLGISSCFLQFKFM